MPIFLLKGNHDADSVVTKSLALPDLARQFSTARAESFELPELRVALHGRGFSHRAEQDNLAIAFPRAKEGWFNIGVLHSSLDGRPGQPARATLWRSACRTRTPARATACDRERPAVPSRAGRRPDSESRAEPCS